MASYMDENGVLYLWSKVKAKITDALSGYLSESQSKELFATKDAATTTAAGLMSATDKSKLDGIATGANKYTHPTTSGNKHIPSGGSSGKILVWSADGTAAWGDDKDTTYTAMTAATTDAAGKSGLVPAPPAGSQYKYLSGDGNFYALGLDTGRTTTNYTVKLTRDGNLLQSITLATATASAAGLLSSTLFSKLNALPAVSDLESTYAKKSDIVNMYKYKGSVADASKLPTTGQTTGDVYNIESASVYGGAGANVAWNGSTWDPLGEIFTVASITNAQIDTICV